MGKDKTKWFYAVASGHKIGIYDSWSDCRTQVSGYGNAKYKKFSCQNEAQKYIDKESKKQQPAIDDIPNTFSKTKNRALIKINDSKELDMKVVKKECDTEDEDLWGDDEDFEKLFQDIKQKSKKAIYVVARGHKTGFYDSWEECKTQISGFAGAKYKKFFNHDDALRFIEENSQVASSSGKSLKKKDMVALLKRFHDEEKSWIYDEASGYQRDKSGRVKVYVDGACSNNGKSQARAGVGVYFGKDSKNNISEPLPGPTQTNNRAEIRASVRAIQTAKRDGNKAVTIYTDSKFVMDSVTDYMPSWKQNNWQKASGGEVVNKSDFMSLDKEMRGMDVKFVHVPAHCGISGNENADRLARQGAQQ